VNEKEKLIEEAMKEGKEEELSGCGSWSGAGMEEIEMKEST